MHRRAPWWNVEGDAPPGALLPTAGIVGLLLKNGVEHPWAFCWRAWNRATTLGWRGWVTIGALTILRAYGRLAR